jgi:stringent starvation protein B
MKSRRPYLLRAMHEWITDSQCTPHVVVDASVAGVEVPRQYVQDGKIVLNVSWSATSQLQLGNDELSFSGRFGGASLHVRVPLAAVLAIYARETGQGMIFSDEGEGPPPSGPPQEPATKEGDGPPKDGGGRPKLKVVK